MLHAVLALSLATQLPIDSVGLERAADRILGHRPEGLAGAALVVVQGGRMLLLKGYGSAGNSGPVDPSMTLFRAASVGKLFVATAAMQLRESGKLDLDRNIAEYLPELERRGWPPVTMRQLLSHTAGVEDAGKTARLFGSALTAGMDKKRPAGMYVIPKDGDFHAIASNWRDLQRMIEVVEVIVLAVTDEAQEIRDDQLRSCP